MNKSRTTWLQKALWEMPGCKKALGFLMCPWSLTQSSPTFLFTHFPVDLACMKIFSSCHVFFILWLLASLGISTHPEPILQDLLFCWVGKLLYSSCTTSLIPQLWHLSWQGSLLWRQTSLGGLSQEHTYLSASTPQRTPSSASRQCTRDDLHYVKANIF